MYIDADFIVGGENREAYKAVKNLVEVGSGNVVICGPEGAGKTHLLNIGREKGGKSALLCSTAAIMLRFDLDLGDDFFDQLGEIPLLFVDEIDAAVTHPETAKLLELMIAERNRRGLATCFAARQIPDVLDLPDLARAMECFSVVEVAPFGIEGIRHAVDEFCGTFAAVDERKLDDSAREYVARIADTLPDARNMVQFLLQAADVETGATIDEQAVRRLIA